MAADIIYIWMIGIAVLLTAVAMIEGLWWLFLIGFITLDNYLQERYWKKLEANKNIVPYMATPTESSHETSMRP